MTHSTASDPLTPDKVTNKESPPIKNTSKSEISNSADNLYSPCILNGLLYYVGTVIQNSTRDKIVRLIVSFYNNNDIINAKRILWSTCDKSVIGDYYSRNNSPNRSQSEANTIDIIEAMVRLDQKSVMPKFAASFTDKVPLRYPEELNLLCISERLNKVEAVISTQTDIIASHDNKISKLNSFNNLCRSKIMKSTESNMTNINSEIKRNDTSSDNNCKSPDTRLTKMNTPSSSKKAEDIPEGSLNKPPTAKGNNNNPINDGNTNENQSVSSQINVNLSYAQRTQTNNSDSDTANNVKAAENSEPTYRIVNNKIIDENGYELVVNNNNKKIIEQINNNNKINTFSGPSNNVKQAISDQNETFTGKKPSTTVDMWIYRIVEGNCTAISDHFSKREIKILQITKVSNDEAKYKSFKIKILKTDVSKVRSKGFLPENVGIKFWRETNMHTNYNNKRFNRY